MTSDDTSPSATTPSDRAAGSRWRLFGILARTAWPALLIPALYLGIVGLTPEPLSIIALIYMFGCIAMALICGMRATVMISQIRLVEWAERRR